ncbi:MAG: hypothetical protein HKP48_02650 [Winogradskyella sp.]|uniref:hypothetical protein n=1 Tax=Winogradskyella sp. TaxID=1883156 RepID=UPI00181524A6|nr:hypothetical protein [Winogradskyella sp.]MBT8244946.1 hypothetical protein [Winogradskyella sp.]NNK22212.1 hypothetical protein [Winogradskyella sp.]
MHRILKIVAAVIGVLGIIFLVRIISAGDDVIKSGEEAGLVDPMAYTAYAILIAVVAAVVFFIFRNIMINPSGLKNTLIGVGAFALVLIVSYVVSGGDTRAYKLQDGIATEGQSQMVGAGLTAFYILLAVAAVSMIFSGVKKILSK